MPFVLAQIGSPNGAIILSECGSHECPIHKVLRVPDGKSRRVIEGRVSQEEIVANPNRPGVRMVSAEHGVQIGWPGALEHLTKAFAIPRYSEREACSKRISAEYSARDVHQFLLGLT